MNLFANTHIACKHVFTGRHEKAISLRGSNHLYTPHSSAHFR